MNTTNEPRESLEDLLRDQERAQVEAERGMAILIACVVSLSIATCVLGIASGWW